jgi:hypothetical protein
MGDRGNENGGRGECGNCDEDAGESHGDLRAAAAAACRGPIVALRRVSRCKARPAALSTPVFAATLPNHSY